MWIYTRERYVTPEQMSIGIKVFKENGFASSLFDKDLSCWIKKYIIKIL